METEDDAEILKACGIDLMQGNLFGEASLALPWARKEDLGFASLDTVDQLAAALEETKVFTQIFPQSHKFVQDVPDNAAVEEGLSRLKLAVRALDEGPQFTAFDEEVPLAEAVLGPIILSYIFSSRRTPGPRLAGRRSRLLKSAFRLPPE